MPAVDVCVALSVTFDLMCCAPQVTKQIPHRLNSHLNQICQLTKEGGTHGLRGHVEALKKLDGHDPHLERKGTANKKMSAKSLAVGDESNS